MEEKNKATFRTLESNKFIYSGPDISVLDTSKETLREITLRSPFHEVLKSSASNKTFYK